MFLSSIVLPLLFYVLFLREARIGSLICRSVKHCYLLPTGQTDKVLTESVQTDGERGVALGMLHSIEKHLSVDNTDAHVQTALLEVALYKRAEDLGRDS
jgi:hypothetical protein